jgi:hypothetical protein
MTALTGCLLLGTPLGTGTQRGWLIDTPVGTGTQRGWLIGTPVGIGTQRGWLIGTPVGTGTQMGLADRHTSGDWKWLCMLALMYHSVTCRTGKEYGNNQGMLLVWKLI